MAEIFCEDCEQEIKLSLFGGLTANTATQPTKFKDGYRCVECTKRRKARKVKA